MSKKPIGKILVEAGLISLKQVEIALLEQKYNRGRIGSIFANKGWIEQETIDFFCEQWFELLKQKKKQPLVYYLQAAKLIEYKQIDAIAMLQKSQSKAKRFHRLAVEQGYIKQVTIDFFLAHIYNVYDPQKISVIKPYELIKKYARGEKNFVNYDLSRAPLTSISLSGVILDDSNLMQANLSRANINRSSLIRVDLSFANLTRAIFKEIDFTESYLIGANLQNVHLAKANFQSAILHRVDLRSAYLSGVNFAGADLSQTKLSLAHYDNVYYNNDTTFDSNFNPKLAGWKMIG